MTKYRAQKTTVGDITFDSKLEARRWWQLQQLEKAREISGLQRQFPIQITVNGVPVCKYVCDFIYIHKGRQIFEDAKGVTTPIFNLKRKLVKACHNIDITIFKG